MRILLDVDGVFADFVGATISILKESGYEKYISPNDITSWDIISCLDGDWGDVITSGWRREGWFENLKVYDGSHEAFETISSLFDEVFFVTSPMPNHKTWCHERISWLKKNFQIKSNQVIITESKHVVFGDVLIDDSFANISSWSNNSWASHPVLWSRPYNQKNPAEINGKEIVRTNDWNDFINYAKSNVLYQF